MSLIISCHRLPEGTTYFEIEGKVGKSLNGVTVVLAQHGQAVDTVVIQNGEFKFKKLLWNKKICTMMFWRYNPKGASVPIKWGHGIDVFVDGDSQMILRAENDDEILYNRYIIETDSKINKQFDQVRVRANKNVVAIELQLAALGKSLDIASESHNEREYNILLERLRILEEEKSTAKHYQIKKFIEQYPNSYPAVYWLSNASDIYVNTPFYTNIARKLAPEFRQHPYGKVFLATLADATNKNSDTAQVMLDLHANLENWKSPPQNTKLLVLDFWASWCVPCLNEIPKAIVQKGQLRKDGVDYVFLSYDTNKLAWQASALKNRLSDSYWISEKKYFTDFLAIHNIPRYVIVNAKGKVMVKHAGKPGSSELKAQIDSCLLVAGH